MRYEEIDLYVNAAMNVMDEIPPEVSADGWNQFVELDKALGIREYRDFYYSAKDEDDPPLNEELKKLLVMLAGPHGKTVLRIYQIKKGLK